ncbi:MAG: valine--tRNA ligase [Candidatus Levybacteria bacterium]|nr:valine--tRNA ligase [Candidatus Levybacteria bacterium]
MDKTYNHKDVEQKIYKNWEEKGYFRPENRFGNKENYSIILPPPNANAPLHFGHAMYVIEDILARYHRMKGDKTLWLPGADHAGFETQFVFEKKLQDEGKSRFDFSREELYRMILDFVGQNRPVMEGQLKRLGFSLDWSRKKFTLDSDIVKIVHKTFKKLYDEGFAYRAQRLVNYCTFDGTSFSDLEVVWQEKKDPLYYIKYGPLVLATTRPETKFGDTAVAVHAGDKRYQKYIGKELEIETVLGKTKIKVIADKMVDPEFGTGVVKITPAHDFDDFETAQRHNLPMKQVIGFDGKMNENAGKFAGMYVKQARKAIIEEMQQKGLIEKVDENYTHRIGLCYKCKNVLEPLPLEQWFIKMEPLAKPAIEAVRKGNIKIFPKNFEKLYFQFLEGIRDWNISRQVVWGIRIPAWRCMKCNEIKNPKSKIKNPNKNSKINNNLAMEQFSNEGWVVTEGEKPEKCPSCGSGELEQDPDTFDTWFSSAQWPFATLLSQSSISNFSSKGGSASGGQFPISNENARMFKDYAEFYPTTVMETGYDILRWWVARMVMIGLYATGKVPFKNVVLHGLVNDPLGKKMSKSKGNVVNPLELVDKYGADAVRFTLVYGTALGNDQTLSFEKLEAMRNFSNKLWNIARFIDLKRTQNSNLKTKNLTIEQLSNNAIHKNDKEWIEKINLLVSEISGNLDKYQFNYAAEKLYEFIWHQFADIYIEDVKNRIDENSYLILTTLYLILLKLLHPFMPFITEEIYQRLGAQAGGEESLTIEKWPSFA